MTVMSLLASKFKKIILKWVARGGGGFQGFLSQLPRVIVCHELMIWRLSPVTLYFFPLCVLRRCPQPPYFKPKPNLSKTLESLFMQLVIFVNTFFQLNSLNITVSVCYVSGSKVNRKERSRPSLFVCFCVPLC